MGMVNSRMSSTLEYWYGARAIPAAPASYWVALSTTTPNSDGSNFTEPAGGLGYTRQQYDNISGNFTTASLGTGPNQQVVRNVNAVAFDQASGSWGTITHWGLYDAASGGNVVDFGPLTTARNVQAGEQWSFAQNEMQFRLNNTP